MFSSCCGCRKNTVSEKPKAEPVEFSQGLTEVKTNKEQSCPENKAIEIVENENNKNEIEDCTSSKCVSETPRVSVTVISNDGDSDEVFAEGTGPAIPLASNLATPHPSKKGVFADLPQWFSEEGRESDVPVGTTEDNPSSWQSPRELNEEGEISGLQEPPATPIGKDELALRRHRFFSELVSLSKPDAQHRVRFDPLGPIVAPIGVECECSKVSGELELLVVRLENVTTRLEKTLGINTLIEEDSSKNTTNMSVNAFNDILQGPFAQYCKLSQEIGGEVAVHSGLVRQAFDAQLHYITLATTSKSPSQSEQMALLQPTSQHIGSIQQYREKNRVSPFFNHLSAISESIPALGWVTVSPAPAPYVKEMNDAGQFYTNRVLKEWKEKDKKHMEWVKAWIQTLTELQQFVKQYHTTGLVWSGKGAVPPPPPPACPPPPPAGMPPMPDFNPTIDDDRSALFAQINQGENITKSLKKVTDDMQTHKNTALRTGPAPFKAPTTNSKPASGPIDKPPTFNRDGKKWLIEYQKGNHNLLVENAEMNNVVYLYKCVDSTVTVKGKINSIMVDSCKKTSLVFDTLVSAIEFINCQSVQMQVLGKVATISIDKTDGCQVYLSPESLNVEIISSKSSEMNVMVPQASGDYAEYPVPEQYKTTVVPGKGLQTIIVENKG